MNIILWIVQILLALAFGAAGLMKATKPVDTMVARMAWAADYSPRTIKLIGVVEILGALGLILTLRRQTPGMVRSGQDFRLGMPQQVKGHFPAITSPSRRRPRASGR